MKRAYLENLVRRWRRITVLREVLFALAAAAGLVALALGWRVAPIPVFAAGFLVIFSVRLALSRPWAVTIPALTRHLDRTNPSLEESSALWLRPPESLTLPERLQLRRVEPAFSGLVAAEAGGPPPGHLRFAGWCCLLGFLILALTWVLAARRPAAAAASSRTPVASRAAARSAPPAAAGSWPRIVHAELSIVPPAYTGRPARRVDGFNAAVEEGAAVTWQLTLDRPVQSARLVFGETGADALPLAAQAGVADAYAATRAVADGGLYHLSATLPDGTTWSPPEIFSLGIIRDRPPDVRIVQPAAPRTRVDAPGPVRVECVAVDDYGLVDTHLVATVAKGSGEAVKFREQAFPFDANDPVEGNPLIRHLTKTLDLAALGLEAGDELYFFVEARDNRQPAANRTRSETRFVTVKGPAVSTDAAGLGVGGINLIPQYFRSERQLIIDTEKLIADQPALPAPEFRRRANDLGLDQQLLRLRYGRFVGEELEQSAVDDHTETHLDPLQANAPVREGPRAAASVALRFQQEHAEQAREGGDDANPTGLHAAPGGPLTADQVRQPYVDEHDSQDKATYFDHETKGTLRDALAAMWEAEGLLRTSRPPDALAPEHRALEILKDLQQTERAYVQHVGFEAPPLEMTSRRLQGDVKSVPPRAATEPATVPGPAVALTAVREALAGIRWEQPASDAAEMDRLRAVEPALTAAATRQPQAFLDGLRALRQWLGGDPSEAGYRQVEGALWQLLPAATPLPERSRDAAPSLAGPYFDGLALDKMP